MLTGTKTTSTSRNHVVYSIIQWDKIIEIRLPLIIQGRVMENISRGPTFGDFITILTEGSMQDNTVARLQSTKRLSSPPSIKCNVLREGLSEESQNIPCATLKEK